MSSVPFSSRHLGASGGELEVMAREVGADSLEGLIDLVVPEGIRRRERLELPEGVTETAALERLRAMMAKNRVMRSLIGMGYADCIVPPVVQRNILENPGWYTAYTPYQAEIAQGRLEALLNFQTMICGLTGLDVANASLLDEGTAVAEAVAIAKAGKAKGDSVFLSDGCHPQTIDVVRTRCEPLGIEVIVGDFRKVPWDDRPDLLAVVVQYPTTLGEIEDYAHLSETAKERRVLVVAACDLLALTLLKPPGEWGADIAVGSAQRFGVPLGYGGPHAAFMAVRDGLKRKLPGRLVGVSKDANGKMGFRLALQTREQHIRRDKATSNICTAQVLLAVMASMYAVYHGPHGLRRIAKRINSLASRLKTGLTSGGLTVVNGSWFDTVVVRGVSASSLAERGVEAGVNLRVVDEATVGISLDEKSTEDEVAVLLGLFGAPVSEEADSGIPEGMAREAGFLEESVFNRYHTETEMLRYLRRLEVKDLALNTSMIPLGSCTMKLNATAEMMPLSWDTVGGVHPFAPQGQTRGYAEMFRQLEWWLAKATGFAAVSLQPNAGSQGEFAGLMAIRRFHQANGEGRRKVCLIPSSAHGTNPASAVMAGMRVVAVGCDDHGNIDVADLKAKVEANSMELSALMVTYPSTHGVFEESITEICEIVHRSGGQVYMDGANLNAQLGLTSPGACGADVCHLNLHKTFCIPHGGGGPGVGPIGVASHLVEFLPGHRAGGEKMGEDGAVCSAPWGSASICTISWMYIAMMGGEGLTKATKVAILNANYVAKRLERLFPVLYTGVSGFVAHECIIDLRPFKSVGIEVEDVAKRLIDYGFHSPTMSWPVPGTLMIEPTESESREELDRFCEAMISIHGEIEAVRDGRADPVDNVLKNAPHPAEIVCSDSWGRPYGREQAAYPLGWLRERKFWPAVGRIDNVYGDRNLVCSCAGMEDYKEA